MPTKLFLASRRKAKGNKMISSPEILHKNKKPRKAGQSEWLIRIVEIKKLGGWVYARGPKNIVMSAVFNSREEAQAATNWSAK
jgi:hypothetical protein